MAYDGPAVFRAPIGNDTAQENFHRTVLDGVSVDRVADLTDRTFDGDTVRMWGTKESVQGSWKKVSPGDFLIFYEDGEYSYGAEVIDTELNEELGREIWPNHEEDSPWLCLIYLMEPVDLGVDSMGLHDLAGYDIAHTMGFSPLSEMGIGAIRGKYGSVENFIYGDQEAESHPDAGLELDTDRRDAQIDDFDRESEIDVTATPQVSIPESTLDHLHFPDDSKTELVDQIQSALNAGKHVIFTGAPGTGKTEIARAVAQHLVAEHGGIYSGHQMTTATADWSTFETVGGYMPEEAGDGDLAFEPGQVLRRFKRDGRQRNELLVIDEINRADIDKSFGQLFTLLSGQGVQLPFKRDGAEIEIVPAETSSGDLPPHRYVMPASWFILATMNSYDKTSLYELSYAFMRRFAFIHVDAPDVPADHDEQIRLLGGYADVWDLEVEDQTLRAVAAVWHVTNTTVEDRKLGPAIVRDILTHIQNSPAPLETALTQSIANYVFPQLEGVRGRKKIAGELIALDAVDERRLSALAQDVLGVDLRSEA